MNRLARHLRLGLVLCLVALGLVSASSAQATPGWKVNGSLLTSGTRPVGGEMESPGLTMNTKIGGNEVKFSCKKGAFVGVEAAPEGKIAEGGKLKFSECTTAIKGVTQKACEPINGAEKGVIVTNKGKGQLAEHSTGEGVISMESTVKEKIEGKEVPVFAHIKMGEECSIGEDVPIIGQKYSLVDAGGMTGLLTEAKTHKLKEGPLTEMWAISQTAEHQANVVGIWIVCIEVGGVLVLWVAIL